MSVQNSTDINAESRLSRVLAGVHSRNGAWTILCGSLLLTVLAWYLTSLHVAEGNRERFSFRVSEIEGQIHERMLEYEQVLRGAAGLFEATEVVSREGWQSYVGQCELQRHFPGIQALGFATPVANKDRAEHVAGVRAEGFPDYSISPEGDREKLTTILYIEPFDWRNRRAFGYDMYSNAVRREAMDKAARTGLPAISGKVTLVQETGKDVQPGLLCYLPVYERGADISSPEKRQAAIRGWVYAAFRCNDLMHGMIDTSITDVAFRIYDGAKSSKEHLLYDSEMGSVGAEAPKFDADAQLATCVSVALSGHEWTLQIAAKKEFVGLAGTLHSLLVASAGLIIDLLLFVVISSIGRQRENALTIAKQMTKDLQKSELRTRSILEHASEAILLVSQDGLILEANETAQRVFRSEESLVGDDFNWWLVNCSLSELIAQAEAGNNNDGTGMPLRSRRADRSEFPCRMSIGRLSINGSVNFTVIAHDETARIGSEQQIADINRKLIESSHRAGLAEAATGVLHNVGNVLNSVMTSSGVISKTLEGNPVSKLSAASELLEEHRDDLPDFLTNDPRGRHFTAFLSNVSSVMTNNQTEVKKENRRLNEHVQHVREIIRNQQQHACDSLVGLPESPEELMQRALQLNENRNSDSLIQIVTDFQDCPLIHSDRHRILQVLTNLVANAQDAVRDVTGRPRIVTVRTEPMGQKSVSFVVEDNGVGISEDVLSNLMTFGFTTKPDGHGFGLHSCALVAKSLGGEILFDSDGPGCGARFSLVLPIGEERALEELPAKTSGTSGERQHTVVG